MGNRKWTEDEDTYLLKWYGNIKAETLCKNLNRTWVAIQQRLYKLNEMTSVTMTSGNYTTTEIAKILGVQRSTIKYWCADGKIPTVKVNNRYIINEYTFWKWVKDNINKINVEGINFDELYYCPNWYLDLIKELYRNKMIKGKWTIQEESIAWDLYLKGYTNKEIADRLNRTYESVKQTMYQLKLKKLKKVG